MGSGSELSLQLESRHGVSRIAIDGELDLASAANLAASIADAERASPTAIVLDFNKAYNPPCAFTPFATCPLPPLQNRLPVRLEAGEKKYSTGHTT